MYQQLYPQQQFYAQPANNGFTVPSAGAGYSAGMMTNQGGQQMFAQGQPPTNFVQTLTPEQCKQLQNEGNKGFTFNVEPIEFLRAQCVHKTPDGKDFAITVLDDNTGLAKCTICGAEFNMNPYPDDIVENAMKVVLDTIQQSKLMWLTGPADAMSKYYQYIPLLEKLPKIANIAQKDYAKLNRSMSVNYMPEQRGFQVLDQLGYPQQFMYGQPNPYFQQAPAYGGYPQQQMPPVYGAPAPAYQQAAPAYPQAPVAPQVPVGAPQPNIFGNQYNQQMSGYGYPQQAAPVAPVVPPVAPVAPPMYAVQQAAPVAPPIPTGAPAVPPVDVQPQMAPTAPVEEVTIKGI